MNATQKPDALRLADWLDDQYDPDHCKGDSATELRRLHAENQDLRTRHYCNTAEIESLRARVQELGEMARENRSRRIVELEGRIEELEAQLSAIGAGGVEPLRKSASQQAAHHAEGVPEQVVELEVDDLIDRLLNAQQDLNLAANVHMDQSISSASTLLDEVEIALRTLAATQPAAQGMEKDAEAIRTAVLSCGHTIERDFVTLWFEEKKEGHNALNQLGRRIAAALAAQAKKGWYS